MLASIGVILLVLWLFGVVSGTMLGGFIHVLLSIAITCIIVHSVIGR